MHKNIKKFIGFIGTVRTGHTLISSLLDVHENIAMSIRVNPILKFEQGLSRKYIFNTILNYCKKNKTREIGGYSYLINGETQRNIKKVCVIGDSAATTKNIKKISNDKMFTKFTNFIGIPIYWLWVIRDPFESAHSGYKLSGRSIDSVLELYKEVYTQSHKFYKKHNDKVFIIYLEDFINKPSKHLSNMLDFLEISYSDQYIETCCSYIFPESNKVFERSVWNEKQIRKMNRLIKIIPELRRYHTRK